PQQVDELDRGSGAGAQDLAVLAEDGAVPDVLGPRRWGEPPGVLRGLEDHREVLGLGQADDVQQAGGVQVPQAAADGGQVGGGVAEAAVALLDDQGQRVAVAVREALGEDALGALADAEQPELVEFVDDRLELVVVEALAEEVVGGEGDVQEVVDRQEVLLRLLDQDLPQPEGRRVAALELDDAGAGPVLEGVVGVELAPGRLVEAVEVADREALGGLGLADVQEMLDEHPERGAPFADVVLADDVVPLPLQQADHGVTDDGGPQVA